MSTLHGVLVVDKPGGMTSAAVVARVKRLLGAKRVGHTGTLDPMATGVLPVCVGEGTKVAGYLLAADKSYEGELELGAETSTLDAQGEVTRERRDAAATVDRARLLAAMAELTGPIQQIPPMFSALKHGGRRLHELARAGQEVERAPRSIRVDRFELASFSPPRARFAVDCSKGTYVRSLVADVGQSLGCGAHLTALRRTRSGQFSLANAMQLADITYELAQEQLIDPAEAVAHMPGILVPADAIPGIGNGQRLPWSDVFGPEMPPPAGIVRLLLPKGELLALAVVEEGRLRYQRVFTYALT